MKPLKTTLSGADRRGEQHRGQISRKLSGRPENGAGCGLKCRGGSSAGLMNRWAAGEPAQRGGIQWGVIDRHRLHTCPTSIYSLLSPLTGCGGQKRRRLLRLFFRSPSEREGPRTSRKEIATVKCVFICLKTAVFSSRRF